MGTGRAGGRGGFSAGASSLGRDFIAAGCLGCFSFLLPGQLLCWDSWMLQELGGCPESPLPLSVC